MFISKHEKEQKQKTMGTKSTQCCIEKQWKA